MMIFYAAMLLDQLQSLFNNGQSRQAQEVHLEKPQLLEPEHVVLGDNFLACW